MSNAEFEATIHEDIAHLENLWSNDNVKNADIRNSSHILRRLLINNDLQKCANFKNHKISIEAPDNRLLINAARNDALVFFQSGGTTALGVWFRASTVSKDEKKLSGILKGFDAEAKIPLKIDSFLKQPVFYFQNQLIDRASVIKYVANKAGGPHFDMKRLNNDKILDHIRSAVSIEMNNETPSFCFNIENLTVPSNNIEIVKNSIDPVFIEIATTCRYLTESKSVKELCNLINV